MGLRIQTNVSALRALRNLRINDRAQSQSLERLSTGLRINRASDDPSGLVVSEQLRGQLAALSQAVTNSENSANLVATADAALQEVSNLLVDIQDSIVFAQNTGGSTPAQIAAEQSSVDQAIAAIDRIAATTRFGDRALLNGTADYGLTAPRPVQLQNLTVRSATIPGGSEATDTLTVSVRTAPQRAEIQFGSVAVVSASTVLRISGPRGTEDVPVLSGTTSAAAVNLRDAINSVAGFTGVYASSAGAQVNVFTEEFGIGQTLRLELISGLVSDSGNITTVSGGQVVGSVGKAYGSAAGLTVMGQFAVGDIIADSGRNGVIAFQGQTFEGIGRSFSVLSRAAQFQFELNPDLAVASTGTSTNIALGSAISFTIANTGLTFQLNELNRPTDRINVGIEPMNSAFLGFEEIRDKISEATLGPGSVSAAAPAADQVIRGGFLNSVRTGQGNDLFTNPGNAGEVVKSAITKVASLRGFLGAVQAGTIEPNINAVEVHIENLSSTLSQLRDLDFAAETAIFTRTQILFQSGIATLASANLIPQSVLVLLG